MYYKHSTIALLLSSMTMPLLCFGGSDEDTVKYELFDPVEVTGIRLSSTAPFAFTNMNTTDIQKMNDGKNLPSIFDLSPSVLVSSDDGTGVGYADMRIRGTDNQRINFTINGIPINDGESQGTFFVNFPDLMSSAHSIQIQRGVGSSTNGSGAFGASVNISNMDQSLQPSATIINTIGSFNTRRHTINMGSGRLHNGFNFDVRLSKISSDGYIDRAFSDMKSLQFLAGWTSLDHKSSIKFNVFTGLQKTGQAWNGISQDSLATNRRYNELGIMEDGTYFDDQTDNYQQDYYQLFFNHQFNSKWTANVAFFLTRGKGYYSEYRMDEKFSDYGLPDLQWDTTTIKRTSLTRQLWLDNYNYGTVLGANYKYKNTQINIGGALSQYTGDHYGNVKWADKGFPLDYKWYDNHANKSDINLFVKWEQKLREGLHSFLDLQVRNIQYDISGFRKNPEIMQNNPYTFFNPKAGISYFRGFQKLFVSFAVANKEPNREDFEAGILQTPLPETLYDLELGYAYNTSKWQFSANGYYMYYKHQLVGTGKINDVGAYTRQNVDDSYRTGIELATKVTINKTITAMTNMTFSQNKIKNFTEYIDDYDLGGQTAIIHDHTDIALSPSVIANGVLTFNLWNQKKQSLYVDLIGKYVSRQYLDNTSSKTRSIDPFGIFNMKAAYTFSLPFTKECALIFNVNNIFNTAYESKGYTYSYIAGGTNTYNYYFPQAGTNYSLTFSLGF